MRTSADLWIASPATSAPHRPPLTKLMKAVLNLAFDASQAMLQIVRSSRRKTRGVREDLPWNVGLDHLGETGFPPFVPRGN